MVCGTVHLTAHIIDGCRQLFNGCSLFCGTLGQSLCTVGYLVAACTYLIRDMDNISHGAVQVVPQERAARKMSDGDFEVEIPYQSRDEMGRLSESVAKLLAWLIISSTESVMSTSKSTISAL